MTRDIRVAAGYSLMGSKNCDSVRVQTLFLQPFLGRRGTDYLYYQKLKELERVFPLELRPYNALVPVVFGNLLYAADRIEWRLAHRFGTPMPAWWSNLRRLTVVPQTENYQSDVIFTNFLIPFNAVRTPIVLEADFDIYGPPGGHDHLRRELYVPPWFIRRVTCVIVRHELSRAAYIAAYPQDAEKVITVPFYLPWVEPVPEENVIRKFGEIGSDEANFLFVGNDAWRKGLPNLLKAYHQLRQAGRRVRLTVVSEFRDGQVALSPDITVHSYLRPQDVYALMAEAHVFTMPTQLDASPLVYWEAMANGCALLVPDTSPNRELFGEYGLSTPPDSVQSIARALERFLDDPEFTRECALRGRQAFIDRYHHSVVGKQYWQVFQQAADVKRVSSWNRGASSLEKPKARA